MLVDDRFVGRQGRIEAFKNRLADPYGNNRLEIIIGPGGIGKTWLVKAMLDVAEATRTKDGQVYLVPNLIDVHDTENRHIEGVMTTIAERLQNEDKELFGEHFRYYDEARSHLQRLRAQPGFSQEGLEAQLKAVQSRFLEGLGQFAKHQPTVLAFDTVEVINDTPVRQWIYDISSNESTAGLISIIAGRSQHEQSTLGNLPGLTYDEVLDLYAHRGAPKLTPEEEEWVKILHEKSLGNPLLVTLAISWIGSELPLEELKSLSPDNFKRRIAHYLHPNSPFTGAPLFPPASLKLNQPLRQTLVCAAYLNRRFNKQLLTKLIEGQYIIEGQVDELWSVIEQQLPDSMFYLKDRSNSMVQLHDILAEMIRVFILPSIFEDVPDPEKRIPSPTLQRLTQEDIPTWYDGFIVATDDNYQKQLLRTEKLVYILNTHIWADCHHSDLAGTDETRYLARVLPPDFERGKALIEEYRLYRNDILDRLVISEIVPSMVAQFPLEVRYEFGVLLGQIAKRINLLVESVQYWQAAYDAAVSLEDTRKQVIALIGQDESLTEYDPEQALKALDHALELCKADSTRDLEPTVMHAMGYAYRRLFDLDKAIAWYMRAYQQAIQLEDKEKTPGIINDMGFAYSLAGDYSTAYLYVNKGWQRLFSQYQQQEARLAKLEQSLETLSSSEPEYGELQAMALRQRERLLQSALSVGRSFNTLGLVNRYSNELEQAIADHTEALHYFDMASDNFWRMRAYHSRGDVYRRLAKKHYDEGRVARALEYDRAASEDIEASLNLCKTFGYITELDTVNRRKGRLLHDRYFRTDSPETRRHLLDEAYAFFERALSLARADKDTVEELESLTEIAFLADDYVGLAKDFYHKDLTEAIKCFVTKEI